MPKQLNDLNNSFVEEEENYDLIEDLEYEESEDYSDIETIEEQYERNSNIEEEPQEDQSLPLLKAILLSILGQKTGYTKIDQKLQDNTTAKVAFMMIVVGLFFISILLFVLLR